MSILPDDIEYVISRNLSNFKPKKIKQLIKFSFNKNLVDDYFDYTKESKVIVAKYFQSYIGIIIFELIPKTDISYLDKIAVLDEFKGIGIGKELWYLMGIDYCKSCWRSKMNNPINSFYEKKSDFVKEIGQWNIYCKNLDENETNIAIDYALSKKETIR